MYMFMYKKFNQLGRFPFNLRNSIICLSWIVLKSMKKTNVPHFILPFHYTVRVNSEVLYSSRYFTSYKKYISKQIYKNCEQFVFTRLDYVTLNMNICFEKIKWCLVNDILLSNEIFSCPKSRSSVIKIKFPQYIIKTELFPPFCVISRSDRRD